MALKTDPAADPVSDRIVPRRDDQYLDNPSGRSTGRSNFAAFLLGGGMIALGMMAFLYYDSNHVRQSDDITTGSIGRMIQGVPASPNVQVPARPAPVPER